jgi:Rieske Fe-S protein
MSERTGRRVFLKLSCAAAGVVGIGGLGCGDEDEPAKRGIDAGKASAIAVGSITGVADKPLVIARDARGFYAMTTICTHQKCDIRKSGEIRATELECNCHGSKYDANGQVINGPAPKPLEHYKVEVGADGTLSILNEEIVDKDVRTPAPA